MNQNTIQKCGKVIEIHGTIIGTAEFRCQREQDHKGSHKVFLHREVMLEKQSITVSWKTESKK